MSGETGAELWQLWSSLPEAERWQAIEATLAKSYRAGFRMATPGADLVVTPEAAEAAWKDAARDLGVMIDKGLAVIYGRRVLHSLMVWPVANKTHTVGNMTGEGLRDALKAAISRYETRREI